MLMTEIEARKRMCPFSVRAGSKPFACRASSCMGWRVGSDHAGIIRLPDGSLVGCCGLVNTDSRHLRGTMLTEATPVTAADHDGDM